ncbi:glycoside hydrolase family 53 protein [Cohnella algarum]|uniref:glycoside hydrolase family 53 protein n=1 Tax=Cohnella algarum TaxID=2044859 RepID=UPI001F0777BB|nr:arabinogalactan endo-1,4-beta-galactosidase [Cohnella algarum]
MKKQVRKLGMLALLLGLLLPAASPKAQAINPGGLIVGADVSMLNEVEELGGSFYENGIQKDPLEILSGNGMNYVRLRLWVDPYDSVGNPYGGGTNDLATTIALAERAKAEGMGILLDLHLSDFWADPGTQTKPKAWQSLTYAQLKTAVYNYTKGVITAMKAEGVLPEMVQVGNETSSGILWDDGKVGGGIDDFTQLGELLSAGISGIDDALGAGEDVEIALHLDHGGDNNLYRWWFDKIEEQGVDYDIIGLSYYPFWHGTMGELQYNLNDISKRYGKDVMIVETAYGWTLGDGDGLGNSFYTTEESVGGYPASAAGQMAYIRDLAEIVRDVPNGRGRGIFWWEPAWLPVEGANWGRRRASCTITIRGCCPTRGTIRRCSISTGTRCPRWPYSTRACRRIGSSTTTSSRTAGRIRLRAGAFGREIRPTTTRSRWRSPALPAITSLPTGRPPLMRLRLIRRLPGWPTERTRLRPGS